MLLLGNQKEYIILNITINSDFAPNTKYLKKVGL